MDLLLLLLLLLLLYLTQCEYSSSICALASLSE